MPHVSRPPCRLFAEGFGPACAEMIAALATIESIELVPDASEADCVYRRDAPGDPTPAPGGPRTLTFVDDVSNIASQTARLDGLTRDRNMIVVASRWSRDRMVEQGVAAETIAVVPYGVETQVFAPLSPAERAAARVKLGIRDDEVLLLNVSDSSFEAGFDILMTAFATLRARGHRVRLALKHEDLAATPNYHDALVKAAASSPAILQPATLDAILILPAALARTDLRLLYGAADCYVSPYRVTPFNLPVLEAIATGTPVIVTDGGATDDFCDHDAAWRISGRPRRREALDTIGRSGRYLEPDLDELIAALTAVVRGAGFDRARFASVRLEILTDYSWARAAYDLASLIVGGRGVRPPFKPKLLGLSRPAAQGLASARHTDLPEKRRDAMDRIRCPDGHSLSIVVQGPCIRAGQNTAGLAMEETLASLRRTFPNAQIVVSTWLGSDVDGLDADDVVLSPDPGPLDDGVNKTNNVNRVITSTSNGLAAATRRFCIKTRNDILFSSDDLISKDLRVAADTLSLERRIWVEASRLETSLRAFHPSDIIQFGMTDDLRRLWDVPLVRWDQSFLPDPTPHVMRAACEQSIFIGYLRGIGIDVSLETTFDIRYQTVAASLEFMLGAFDIFNPNDEGVVLPIKFRENPIRPALMETRANFDALREAFGKDRRAACARIYELTQDTLRSMMTGTKA